MRKLIFLTLITLTAAPEGLHAEVLSPARALARINESPAPQTESRKAARRIAARADLTPVRTISRQSEPALYLFSAPDGGLMVVSAESETRDAVMGYSENYTAGMELPPAMEMMMSAYAAEIAALRASAPQSPQGQRYVEGDYDPIAPMCPTRWNQDAPYNALCPELNGRQSVTGCVATAMAQVLYTYRHPERCTGGRYTYTWEYGRKSLTLDFDNVSLDWESMATTYEATDKAPAVAALMQAIGYASNMNYSPSASGTYAQALTTGLIRNFDYDCRLSYERRNWYPLAIWQKKIYDELAEGHPVYYDGSTADYSAGHAFVVDGYGSDGYFHLNWGWGGMSDGYFKLSALDPSLQGIGGSTAGYDVEQGAIIGLRPGDNFPHADAPYVYFSTSRIATTETTVRLGNNVRFTFSNNGGIFNNGPMTTAAVHPAVKFTSTDGVARYYRSNTRYENIPINSGFGSFDIVIPTSLTDGTYEVVPAVYNPSDRKYYDVRRPLGVGSIFHARVENGSITFLGAEVAMPQAFDVVAGPEIHPSTYFNFSTRLANDTDRTYIGSIFVALCSPGQTSRRTDIGAFAIEMAPGEATEVNTVLKAADGIASGDYDLVLFDMNNRAISDPVAVSVTPRPAEGAPRCTSIRCTDTAKDHLTFEMEIVGEDGLYADNVYLIIKRAGASAITDWFTGQIVILPQGATTTVSQTVNFSAGKPGERYVATPSYFDGWYITAMPGRRTVTFTLSDEAAIDEISVPESEDAVEYYDLSGRRTERPRGGIFIRRQGENVSKVQL